MMTNILHFAVLVAALSIAACKYEIEMRKFEVISKFINKDIIDPGTLRLKQEQRNQFTLSGYFVVQRDIVPSDTVRLEYHKKTLGDNYIPLFISTMTICESTNTRYYLKLQEASNFPPPNTCPIAKGNYSVNNLIIDESFFPSIMPTGENFIIATFSSNGRPAYGVKLFTEIRQI